MYSLMFKLTPGSTNAVHLIRRFHAALTPQSVRLVVVVVVVVVAVVVVVVVVVFNSSSIVGDLALDT